MTKWGVPDWHDVTAYPADLPHREWWWEFTRRHPDYRVMWEGAAALDSHDYRCAPDVDAFRLRFQLSVIRDPAQLFTDWQLMHYHYGPNYARSPREPLLKQLDHPSIAHSLAAASRRQKFQEDKGHTLYNFDLSQPLGPQFERAKQYLKTIQAELFGKQNARKNRTLNWPLYFRALDAKDDGATYAKMKEVFWPGRDRNASGSAKKTDQSARDTYEAARRLRDNFPI